VNVDQHLLAMRYAFCTALKLAHPFLPFVTEEIWSVMTEERQGLLLDTRLPDPSEVEEFRNVQVYEEMNKVLQIVKEIRSLKSRYFGGSKDTPNIYIETHVEDTQLDTLIESIATLTRCNIYLGTVGQFSKSDLIGVLFDFEGGRSCRVSVSRVCDFEVIRVVWLSFVLFKG
jgi:valyl-tRNA synthetase